MLALLSPSKTLDFETPPPIASSDQPLLLHRSEELIEELQRYSEADIGKLMKISDKLAALNYERFQHFSTPFTPDNAKPAIFAFKGDVYDGLDAETLSDTALKTAQHSIRMLSGLYGLLKPFDLIQPYRLEMGAKLANPQGKDLYTFWGDMITHLINEQLKEEQIDTVINLASNEYFSAVRPKQLNGRLVTIHFKENKNGQLKVIGLFAKKARGMMARFIAENNPQKAEDLQCFAAADYRFMPKLSDEANFIFARG